MKLMVIILSLLSERFLIHAISLQRFFWFTTYASSMILMTRKNLAEKDINPYVLLALLLAPILISGSFVYILCAPLLFGLIGFVLSLCLFFYSLGPQNVFYPLSTEENVTNEAERTGAYFSDVNGQLFTVVFWYVIAGPIAALAYRLVVLSQNIDLVRKPAQELSDLLEWLPARMTALLYLLVGNFQKGLVSYIKYLFSNPKQNDKILRECGLLALSAGEANEVNLPNAEQLVERATIVLLVLIALFTLVAWL